MSNISYKKYLKYKAKYLNLKNNLSDKSGGVNMDKPSEYIKISGPVSCTRYRINDGEYIKDIYIFGDVHKIINPCKEEEGKSIEFQEYLGELFSNSQKLIDFFYEVPIQREFEDRPNPQFKDNFLSKIRNKFRNCLLKKSCPYPKVRFHCTDPRDTDLEIPYWEIVKKLGPDFIHPEDLPKSYNGEIKKVDDLTQEEFDNFYYQKSDEIYDVCINEIFPFINDNFSYKRDSDLYNNYVLLLETSNLLKKEIDKAGRYSHNILNFSTSKIKQIIEDDWPGIVNFYYNFKNYKNDKEKFKIIIGTNYLNILENINHIIFTIIAISSVLMDSYVLSRVLKEKFSTEESSDKYKSNEEKYGPEHIYIKNIIIYAGESHCQNYRDFLDINDFDRENIAIHTEGEDNQCIELKSHLFS